MNSIYKTRTSWSMIALLTLTIFLSCKGSVKTGSSLKEVVEKPNSHTNVYAPGSILTASGSKESDSLKIIITHDKKTVYKWKIEGHWKGFLPKDSYAADLLLWQEALKTARQENLKVMMQTEEEESSSSPFALFYEGLDVDPQVEQLNGNKEAIVATNGVKPFAFVSPNRVKIEKRKDTWAEWRLGVSNGSYGVYLKDDVGKFVLIGFSNTDNLSGVIEKARDSNRYLRFDRIGSFFSTRDVSVSKKLL